MQLFAISLKSDNSEIFVWGLLAVLFVFFVWSLFHQRKTGKQLRFELEQLGKLNENNVEAEFVLRAMKLITWHLDPKTMIITFDNDFRDKRSKMTSFTDGLSVSIIVSNIHPQDAERLDKALSDLCAGITENYHEEYRVLIPHSDKCYWEESYATVVERDVEGKPTSIVGTTQIIDDRKLMEAELIAARNNAEESNRMKSAFIAHMSHEIRTPLNAIVGFTSLLPDITSDEERRGLLDLISDNSQKLLNIINDVVNISSIESGQAQIQLSSFDLNQVLAEQVERFRNELKPGVELKTEFGSEALLLTTDLNRFNEIFKHLLSNAVKFTAQGSIVVGYDAPKDGRVTAWVSDTGIGIAEENRKRIFERFFKIDEFVPGAGLGLSICQTMANSLGGSVTVESKPGQGSKFMVEIPIQESGARS